MGSIAPSAPEKRLNGTTLGPVRLSVSCSKRLHRGVDAGVTNLPSKLPSVGRSTFRRRSASPAIGTTLSGNAVRLEAIYNVEAYVPPGHQLRAW